MRRPSGRRPRRGRVRRTDTPHGPARSATYMSTALCLTAWNEPIGTPNWWRSLTYSTVMSRMRCDAPTVGIAQPSVASATARSMPPATSAAAETPVGRHGDAGRASGRRCAPAESKAGVRSATSPDVSRSTTNTAGSPSTVATMAISSARSPSTTWRTDAVESPSVVRRHRGDRSRRRAPAHR